MRKASRIWTVAMVFMATFRAPSVWAQSNDELTVGRQLFAEALQEEDQRHFATALEKYRAVQRIRDTVQIRYRIASCLDGLGQLVDAKRAYEAALALGNKDPSADHEVIASCKSHLSALLSRIGHLSFRLGKGTRGSLRLTIDGTPVSPEHYDDAPVNPGPHVVTGSLDGVGTVETRIQVAEGQHLSIPLVFADSTSPNPGGPLASTGIVSTPPSTAMASTGTSNGYRTAGWITTGIGAALAVTGIALLADRQSGIDQIKEACPSNVCPRTRREEISSIQERATLEGTLGGTFLLAGVASLGAGVTLLLYTPTPSSSQARLTFSSTSTSVESKLQWSW
jgi:hypothetical protein